MDLLIFIREKIALRLNIDVIPHTKEKDKNDAFFCKKLKQAYRGFYVCAFYVHVTEFGYS